MEIRFKISSIRYYRSWKWNRSKLDRERIYLDVTTSERQRYLHRKFNAFSSREKLRRDIFFFFFFSILAQVSPETQTALTSNRVEDCLWRCLISQTKGRSGEREGAEIHNPRTIGLIYRCSRTDMGPRPHEALQQAPGCWIRGSCVDEERRVSSLRFPPYIHSRPSASLAVLVLPLRNILPAIFPQFPISFASFQIDYRTTK